MATTGDFQGTGGNLGRVSNVIKIDMADRIYNVEPNLTKLTVLLRQLDRVTPQSYKREWLEYAAPNLYTQINNGAGYTAGSTSLIVDDSSNIAVNSVVLDQSSGETMLVTANNTSTNTITVTRSWGTVAAGTITDNDYIQFLGGAALEGAESELSKVTDETPAFNYIEDKRDPFGVTDIMEKTATYGGKTLAVKRKQRMDDHKKFIEMSLFYGERQTDTSGDERRSTSGGMKEFITTNTTDFSGSMTYAGIVTASQTQGRYNDGVLQLFAAPASAGAIANLAVSGIRRLDSTKTFGIEIDRLTTQHARYNLMTHWLFEGGEHADRCFALNLKNMALGTYPGLDTHLRKNLQAPSATAFKEEWRTVYTLERRIEQSHAFWDNAT